MSNKESLDAEEKERITHLYTEFHRLMFYTAKSVIDNPADCEDVVHECILKLCNSDDTFKPKNKEAISSYIVAITRNAAYDYKRKRDKNNKYLCDCDENDLLEIESDGPTLDEVMILSERKGMLMAALTKLPVKDRILLEGKYFHGYSDKELAQLLRCKPSSIGMKLTRARRKVFKLMLQMEEKV